MAASMRGAFRGAVERILDSWTVLKLAVSHGFGGTDSQEKAVWMVEAVDQWFSENANLDPYEVEDFLVDILSHEFDTVADDGSVSEISAMLCGCYKLCVEGKESQLQERLSRLPQPALHNCVQQHVQQDVHDQDDQEDSQGQTQPVQSQQSQQSSKHQQPSDMETDEDGWQVVKKKGKR